MVQEGKYYFMGDGGIAKIIKVHGTRVECRYYYSDETDIYDNHKIVYPDDSWFEVTPDKLAKLFLDKGDVFGGE